MSPAATVNKWGFALQVTEFRTIVFDVGFHMQKGFHEQVPKDQKLSSIESSFQNSIAP